MRPIRRLLLSGLPLVLTTRWLAMVGAGLDLKPKPPSIVVLSDGRRAHARSARQSLALPVKLGFSDESHEILRASGRLHLRHVLRHHARRPDTRRTRRRNSEGAPSR